jgi:hypothetical protein
MRASTSENQVRENIGNMEGARGSQNKSASPYRIHLIAYISENISINDSGPEDAYR